MSKISNVKVFKSKNQTGTIRGNGSFVLADAVEVRFTVMMGSKGLFVKLPSHKGKDAEGTDKWYNDVTITDEKTKKELDDAVLKQFGKVGDSKTAPQRPEEAPTVDDENIPF